VLLVLEQIDERALAADVEPRAGVAPRKIVDRYDGRALPVAPLGEHGHVA